MNDNKLIAAILTAAFRSGSQLSKSSADNDRDAIIQDYEHFLAALSKKDAASVPSALQPMLDSAKKAAEKRR